MAYQMNYGQGSMQIESIKIKGNRSIGKWIVVAVVVVCLLTMLIPGVSDIWVPGDAQVTKAAAGEMVSRIQSGEKVLDAFAQFCYEIIQTG